MTEAAPNVETTVDWTLVALPAVVAARRDQPSYHIFSEVYARGQIFNFIAGDGLRPVQFDGNTLLIVLSGSVKISTSRAERTIRTGWQLLVNPGVEFRVEATEPSSLEIIWAPPFGAQAKAT